MSHRTAIGLIVLALSAGTLAACQKADKAPPSAPSAPAAAPAIPAEDASMAAATEQERQAQLARAAADPVVGVIERAELCLHFAGEEAYDDARRAQIDKAFEDNRCDAVVADGDALKAAHPKDAARIDAALVDLRG
jgi:hypothetical protein